MSAAPPPRFCAQCGKEAPPGGNFCPNCGAALRAASPAPTAAAAVPNVDAMHGPCILLRTNAAPYNVGAVGKILGKALGKPLSDATRQLSASRGVLAERIEAALARQILPELKSLGVECLLVPLDKIIAFPEITCFREGRFTETGLKCEVVTWDGWQWVERSWSDVMLVSCTQLIAESSRRVDLGGGLIRRREKIVTEVTRRSLLDLFVRNPWCQIRLEEALPGQDAARQSHPTHPLSYLRALARQVLQIVPPVSVNDGVRLLATGAVGEFFSSVAFYNRRDLDQYNLWLLELLDHGLPIPR